jgi:hypothetical protein
MTATLKASLAATMAAALVWGATLSVAVDPEQAKQFAAAAQSAESDGDYDVALREYRRLLEVYPNEPGLQAPVFLAMSQAAYKTGDGEQGRQFAVISHSLDPALDGRVAEEETTGVKTRGGPSDKAATALAIMQAAISTLAALHPPRPPVQQPGPPVYPGTPYGQGGYQPPAGNMTGMPGYPDPNAAPAGQQYPPQGAPAGQQYPPQGAPTDFGPPVIGQPGNPPQGGYQPPQSGQTSYPPQGGYQPPQTGQPSYPPQGAPGGYQPPQTGQQSYPPQGGYQPPQPGQPGYPPQGAQGGYQPPQTGQQSYPPQGAPGGYQPPQTGQPSYPPQGAPGGYQPPQSGQPSYPPQGAPGGYQPPQTGQSNYPPQGAAGRNQPPQTGQTGYPPQGRQAGMPPQNSQPRYSQPGQAGPGRYYPAPPMDQYRPQGTAAPRRATRGESGPPIRVVHDHSRLGDTNYFENSCGALLTVDGGELTFTPGGNEGPRVIPAAEIVEIRLNAAIGKEIGAFHIITKKGLYLHLALASGSRDEARTVVDALRQQLGLE